MSRPPAAERARRVLAMIPWVVAQGGATVADIAEQFGVTPAAVQRDLTEAMCYQAGRDGDMVAVVVDENGYVDALPGGFFDRPRRLTPLQGLAILAAVETLRSAGPTALDTLRTKLLTALEASPGHLAVIVDDPPLLGVVREAIEHRRRLHVRYYSAWRDETTERDIDPYLAKLFGDTWQLFAWCVGSDGWRHFRIDRIHHAHPTGDAAEDHGEPPTLDVFEPGGETERVVIDLTADQAWAAERHPHDVIERRTDGGTRVALTVAGDAWLERLLLRLGPDAVVVEPESLAGLQAAAARRVLGRYGSP